MHLKTVLKGNTYLGILCFLLILLAACGGTSQNTPPSGTNNLTAAPPDKQILREPVIGGDFDTIDPALTNGAGEPLNLLFVGLVGPKTDGTITNELAASYQVSADNLTYTFKLKPNLKFGDGTALTAQDVAYSINRAVLPATKSDVSGYLSLLKDYDKVSAGTIPTLIGDSVIVVDPNTISLVISKPAAYFLETLGYPTSYVVEKKLIDKYAEKWTDHLDEGGTSGPFKVQSYSHTTQLVLVPNDNYFAAKPKIQKIEYIITTDRDSTYKSYQAGQFDVAPVPPALDDLAKAKPGFQQSPALASRFIGLNYLAKPFDIIKIREAFDLAINKDLIINHIIGSSVTPSNHIVPKGIPGYDEKLTGPEGVVGTAGDQAKAKTLFQEGLKEGGYSDVSKLPTITLSYGLGYQAAADTMAAVADEWKQVLGVTVKLVGLQSNDLIKEESTTIGHAGPLQLWYGNWGADYPDPQDWTTLFFGKGSDHNTFNYGQNNSSAATEQQAVQDQLTQADAEQDTTKRFQLYNDAEQKLVNDVVWITTYQSSYSYSVNPKLQNWKIDPQGFLGTDDWANIYFAQ